jgi:DNA-binding transcriptional ArsR family regulator
MANAREPHSPRQLDDARAMRALAHPVRLALLEQLTLRGPMTATQCAELVDESPSSCSFHLRTLAKYGFLEEDTDTERSGRSRPWRVVAIGNRWDIGPETTPELRHAGDALSRVVRDRDRATLEAFLDRQDEFGPEWDDAVIHANYGGYLTAEELGAIGRAIHDLWQPYLHRITDPASRPEGAVLAHFFVHGFPRADAMVDGAGGGTGGGTTGGDDDA